MVIGDFSRITQKLLNLLIFRIFFSLLFAIEKKNNKNKKCENMEERICFVTSFPEKELTGHINFVKRVMSPKSLGTTG